jgi:hypothetical protein
MKLFFFSVLPLLLSAFSWDYSHDFVLKKDKVATIEVIKREDRSKRVLTMRWTLFENERLVLLVKYDGFPTQYVVQKKYKRNSIKIALRDDYHEGSKRAIMIVTFKAFDDAKKTALLKVSVSDPNKRIEITFIDPEKNKG